MANLSRFNTMTFNEVFPTKDIFVAEYNISPFKQAIGDKLDVETDIPLIYYLLYARYAENPIANGSINIFKNNVFSIIYQHGANWKKEMEVQDKLRSLDNDQIMQGAKTIYNSAFNDAGAPSTDTMYETPFINEQNVSKSVKSIVSAYGEYLTLIGTNITDVFLNKFKNLFKKVLVPDKYLCYINEEGE